LWKLATYCFGMIVANSDNDIGQHVRTKAHMRKPFTDFSWPVLFFFSAQFKAFMD